MRKIRREDIYMLLSYEEFKERVMNEFIDYLPEKYSDCILELHQVPKLNEVVKMGRYEFKIIKNTATKIELVRLNIAE